MKRVYRFLFGTVLYWLIELAWDGSTHWSMGPVGGLAFIVGGEIDEIAPDRSWWKQSIIITCIILALEYSAGVLFNKDYKVWDYRGKKFNLDGQICLTFGLIWFVVFGPVIIILDNILRRR